MKTPLIILVAFVSGCANQTILPPQGPPSIVQIASQYQEYSTVNNIPPSDYLQIGVGSVRDKCLWGYFEPLVQAEDKRLFASSEAALLGGIGMGAAAAAGAGSAAPLAIGLASSLLQGTLNNAAIATGAGAFPEETAGLVDRAMTAYLSRLPIPKTNIEADAYVHGFAALCTSTKIHQLMRDSLSTAQVVVEPLPSEAPIAVPNKTIPIKTAPKPVQPSPSAPLPTRPYPPAFAPQGFHYNEDQLNQQLAIPPTVRVKRIRVGMILH